MYGVCEIFNIKLSTVSSKQFPHVVKENQKIKHILRIYKTLSYPPEKESCIMRAG
jgi:hypothetical protein